MVRSCTDEMAWSAGSVADDRTRFWTLYSRTYDVINYSIPYVEHLDALIAALDVRRGARVVDLGCATGNLVRRLAQRGVADVTITGVDFAPGMIARAASKCRRYPSVSLLEADLNGVLPLPDASVDRVVCNNVVYALDDPAALLAEVRRVLAPGGRFVMSDPRPGSSIPVVIREHFSRIAEMPLARRVGNYALTAVTLPVAGLAPILLSRLVIDRRVEQGGYRFRTEEETRQLLSGFADVDVRVVYAGQSWLAVASKGV